MITIPAPTKIEVCIALGITYLILAGVFLNIILIVKAIQLCLA